MKKTTAFIFVVICCFLLVACGSGEDHSGEAKTPSGSSAMEGRDYKSVLKSFEDNGFTNIKLETIDDLITGWLTKEGEVEEVSVGGDFDYSPDKWLPAETEVIIRYHVFPDKESGETDPGETKPENESVVQNIDKETISNEVLTIENCEELALILSTKSEIDEAYSDFAIKYAGRIIEFDGRIDCIANHDNYNTRYDILVSSGDYDPDHQIGPTFKLKDVGVYDLGLDTLFLEDVIKVGENIRIVAKVGNFDSNIGLFFLDPVSVKVR